MCLHFHLFSYWFKKMWELWSACMHGRQTIQSPREVWISRPKFRWYCLDRNFWFLIFDTRYEFSVKTDFWNENGKFCPKSAEVCYETTMFGTIITTSKLQFQQNLGSVVGMIYYCNASGLWFDSGRELFIKIFIELVVSNSAVFSWLQILVF